MPIQPGVPYVKEVVKQEIDKCKNSLPPIYDTLLVKQKNIYYEDHSEINNKQDAEDSVYP